MHILTYKSTEPTPCPSAREGHIRVAIRLMGEAIDAKGAGKAQECAQLANNALGRLRLIDELPEACQGLLALAKSGTIHTYFLGAAMRSLA